MSAYTCFSMKKKSEDQNKIIQLAIEKSIRKALEKYVKKEDINKIVKLEFKIQLKAELKDYLTKKELDKVIEKALIAYPDRIEFDVKFEERMRRFDDKIIQFRSDIFSRFDEIMGELVQIREDRIFTDHDIKVLKEKADDNESRIKKLEATSPTSQ